MQNKIKRKGNQRRNKFTECPACKKRFAANGKADLYCPECRDREIAKSNAMMKKNCSNKGVEELAINVLKMAASDCKRDIKNWHRAYKNTTKARAYSDLYAWSRWWKGEKFCFWAGAINGLDNGAALQQNINRKAFDEIREEKKEGTK